MRLTAKLIVAFMVGNILLAAIYGYLAVQREVRIFERTAMEEAEIIGKAMSDVWRRRGRSEMIEVLRQVADGNLSMRIRWVRFDSRPEEDSFPSCAAERLAAIALGQPVEVEATDADGQCWMIVYWPIAADAGEKVALEFARSEMALDESKRDIVYRIAMLIGGMAVLSGLFAFVLGVRFVGAPLRQLMEKTRRVACGDLTGPIHLASRDELAELGESLNQMCDQLARSQTRIREETAARIAAMEQLRHADRLKTVGRLASGIAHELGTPLNVISGRAGLIASGRLSPEEVNQSAVAIKREAEKMTAIIRQVLDFARPSSPHKAPVDLRPIVRQTTDLLAPLAEKRSIRLDFSEGSEPLVAEADAGQIQQVLTNLIVNAVQAMASGGKVEISLQRRRAEPPDGPSDAAKNWLCIDVRDWGVGIPEEHVQHLFEPFFTTKGVGEGTGLGLSIAYGIVQEHGGWIDVTSRPAEGSCFTVFLPERE